jgi:hypothetical protein
MKINRHHRQPLPGSKGALLQGNAVEPFVLEVEAIGLWEALIAYLPAQLAREIERLIASRTDDEFAAHYNRTIEQVPLTARSVAFAAADGMRAKCPLCSGSPQGAYETTDGFLLPLGMEKHLTGHQRSYECVVLSAARRRAAASVAG